MSMDEDDLVTRCPICKTDPNEERCGHLLASFDLTFCDGEFGWGALRKVTEIQELLDRIHQECALVQIGKPSSAWLVSVRADLAVDELVDVLLEVDVSGYDSLEDLTYDLPGLADDYHGHERELLSELAQRGGQGIGCTFSTSDGMPGQSSAYETWWCADPTAAADSLRKEAKVLLGRPADLGDRG